MNMCPLRFTGIRNPDAPGMNVECQEAKCQWWIGVHLPGTMVSEYAEACAIVFLAKAMASIARQGAEISANR